MRHEAALQKQASEHVAQRVAAESASAQVKELNTRVSELQTQHSAAVSAMRREHEAQIKELQCTHEAALQKQTSEHVAEQEASTSAAEKTQQKHDEELSALRAKLAQEEAAHSACEQLRSVLERVENASAVAQTETEALVAAEADKGRAALLQQKEGTY